MATVYSFDSLGSTQPINDCFFEMTATAGTPIVAVVPPRSGQRAYGGNFRYKAGATAHVGTWMTCMGVTSMAKAAAASDTTLKIVGKGMSDGGSLATNDWLVVLHETTGEWYPYKVTGGTSSAPTVAAIADSIQDGTAVYMFGVPGTSGDYPKRTITLGATTDFIYSRATGILLRSCAGSEPGTPIMFHVDNATNAGTLYDLNYGYDPF